MNSKESNESRSDVVDHASTGVPDQRAAFTACLLENSKAFRNINQDMRFIPINPSPIPLHLSNDSGHSQSSMMMQPPPQPICFLYPPTIVGEQLTNSISQREMGEPSLSSIPPVNAASERLSSNGSTEYSVEEIQQLIQKLIQLQVSLQASNNKSPSDGKSSEPAAKYISLPASSQTASMPPLASAMNGTPTMMNTFLMPVDASFQDGSGALRITPREYSQAVTSNPVKVQCSESEFLIRPYTVETSNLDPEIGGLSSPVSPKALSINDLSHCIRRGSLDINVGQEHIGNSINNKKTSGFVILSMVSEDIGEDISDSNSMANQHTLSKGSIHPEVGRPVISAAQKQAKYRARRMLSDGQIKQRSANCHSKPHSGSLPVDAKMTTSKAVLPQSRFRKTRIADKKETWVANAGVSCLVVHDLWTTKVPDGIMNLRRLAKTTDTLQMQIQDNSLQLQCPACRSNTPKACACGSAGAGSSVAAPTSQQPKPN